MEFFASKEQKDGLLRKRRPWVKRLVILVAILFVLDVAYFYVAVWPIYLALKSAPESFPGYKDITFWRGYGRKFMGRIYSGAGFVKDAVTGPRDLTVKDNPYKIYHSDVEADGSSLTSLYWMDNKRVIFNARPPINDPRPKWVDDIMIWEVGGTATLYKKDATLRCFVDGNIYYTQKLENNGGELRQYFGKLGEEKEMPGVKYVDDMSCEPLMETPAERVGKKDRLIGVLRKEHGYLDVGPIYSNEQSQIILYKPDGTNITLPIYGPAYATYIPYKEAYLISEGSKDKQIDVYGRLLWWLYPDGHTEEVSLPPPWNEGGHPSVYPSKKGLVFRGYDFRKPVKEREHSVFLFHGDSVEQLMADGTATSNLSISPNGCRLAAIFSDSRKLPPASTPYVIDLCEGEN